jgi:hypothetical protein
VGNGSLSQSHANQAFLGPFHTLANRLRDFIGFAEAKAHQSILIPGDHERTEAKAPATLDDLRHPVDMHHLFFDIQSLGIDPLCHYTFLLLAYYPKLAQAESQYEQRTA